MEIGRETEREIESEIKIERNNCRQMSTHVAAVLCEFIRKETELTSKDILT